MAGNVASEITVGANGRVLVADYSAVSVWPTTVAAALPAQFVEVGFVSEDGVTFTDSKTIADVKAWQAFYPVRKIITEKMSKIEFIMQQYNDNTVKAAFGGGIVAVASGVVTYTPPVPGEIAVLAMVLEWTDGTDIYRLVMPRGMVTGEVSSKVTRTDNADLPVSFEATPLSSPTVGQLGTQPWYLLSNAAGMHLT